MPIPLIIDTDMGVDDAVAVALANSAAELDLVGLVSVGGNVDLEQATRNIRRLLGGLKIVKKPVLARGLDQDRPGLEDATDVFSEDGFAGIDLPEAKGLKFADYGSLYEKLIDKYGDALAIVAVGPLTNLAALHRQRPELLAKVGRIVVMGGAVWCPGNITPHAEFNFYRDPQAVADLVGAGLPITVVPLDVTTQIALDESHMAHLSRSGTAAGDVLARMLEASLGRPHHEQRFVVHDALAVGFLLWPQLFGRARMALEIAVDGEKAGQSRPQVSKDKARQLHVVISANPVDFLENMLETLCQEHFVV